MEKKRKSADRGGGGKAAHMRGKKTTTPANYYRGNRFLAPSPGEARKRASKELSEGEKELGLPGNPSPDSAKGSRRREGKGLNKKKLMFRLG